jgi:hypothetical protein
MVGSFTRFSQLRSGAKRARSCQRRGRHYRRAMDIKIDGQTFWERLSKLHKSWTVRAPSSCAALPSPQPSAGAHRRRFCEREQSSAPCLP